MVHIIIRRSQRDLMSPEHVPAHMRRDVSASARGYEEADYIVRKYDRSAEGGPRIKPVMVSDERENDRVEIEGHMRAVDGEGKPVDGEQIVMSRKPKRRVFYGPIS